MTQSKKDIIVRGRYTTRGYLLVKQLLIETDGIHLSADDIFDRLCKKGEKVGRTTVYRQLEKLVEQGFARRITGERGCCYAYADEKCADHYHLVCTVCGHMTHLDCDEVADVYRHIGKMHGFAIDPARTVLYGSCAACTRMKKRKGTTA